MPSVGEFCPGCGTSFRKTQIVLGTTGGIPDRVAGALAYVLLLPAIFFLLRNPFNRNRFIRFHAWQSILVTAATVILFSGLLLGIGWVVIIAATMILAVGWFMLWLVLIVKALQGEMLELPGIGPLARRQSGNA